MNEEREKKTKFCSLLFRTVTSRFREKKNDVIEKVMKSVTYVRHFSLIMVIVNGFVFAK